MKSFDSVILCALLAVFHLKESISMNSNQLTTEKPDHLFADPFRFPLSRNYQFIAYFVKGNKIYNPVKSKFLGSASIVTDRHALTAASVISNYASNDYKDVYILIGGDGSFCRFPKLLQDIEYVRAHPLYQNPEERPFADIAVVVLQKEIDFKTTIASIIPLRLEDVENGFVVSQLGWASGASKKCKGYKCCYGTVRRFQILIDTEHSHLFRSICDYHAELGDHGAPVYINIGDKLELIGITSKPSTLRPSIHMKIYNFLPFIAHELSNDPLNQNRATDYRPKKWISELLKKGILDHSPQTIL